MPSKRILRALAPALLAAALSSTAINAQGGTITASGTAAAPRLLFANSIADVAEAARPSVVHIDTTGTMLQQLPINGPFGIHAPQDSSGTVPVRGLGSGVILDKDGRILTNNHVVENA